MMRHQGGPRGRTLCAQVRIPHNGSVRGERAGWVRKPGFSPAWPGPVDLSGAGELVCGTLCSDGGDWLRPTGSLTALESEPPLYAQQRIPRCMHATLQEPREARHERLAPAANKEEKIIWIIWSPHRPG